MGNGLFGSDPQAAYIDNMCQHGADTTCATAAAEPLLDSGAAASLGNGQCGWRARPA